MWGDHREAIKKKKEKKCLVSGLPSKEIGSHHFVLTTKKKLNTLKNQLFLDPPEK